METIRAVFGHGWVQFVWAAVGLGVCLHAAFAAEKDFAKPNRRVRIAWRFLIMAALGAFDMALCWNQGDEEDGRFNVVGIAIVFIAITALVLCDKLRAEKEAAEAERKRKEIEHTLAEWSAWQPEEDDTTDVPPAWEIDERE